jgi:hypothetical protein
MAKVPSVPDELIYEEILAWGQRYFSTTLIAKRMMHKYGSSQLFLIAPTYAKRYEKILASVYRFTTKLYRRGGLRCIHGPSKNGGNHYRLP